MKHFVIFLIISLSVFTAVSGNRIVYTDPLPGAQYINPQNTIVIGFENIIAVSKNETLKNIRISGSECGDYSGKIKISRDSRKIIFVPASPFKPGEKITVMINGQLLKKLEIQQKDVEFSFSVSSVKVEYDPLSSIKKETPNDPFNPPPPPPVLNVTVNNNPAPGHIFTSPWYINSYLIIHNNSGQMYWNKSAQLHSADFKKQPNGKLTYYDGGVRRFYQMNTAYSIEKTYKCGNGYTTDIHELRILSNGNALMLSYDPQVVDMSQIISGGNQHAIVTGLIIQEIDTDTNVVFQWRSWDHFQITDVAHEDLRDSIIDYVHGNALDVDFDGNILLCSRHLDEITKINRTTGNVIWRLGGRKNQFTFLNDTARFCYQHGIRRLQNGNIILYDNGNYHTPMYARAVEYSLNEQNMTAELVWQYRKSTNIISLWGGFAQRLSNGNTLIAWGGANITMTEVTQAGNIVFEASYPYGNFSYRVFKDEWNGPPLSLNNGSGISPKEYKLYQNNPNPFNPATNIKFELPAESYTELTVYDITGREIQKIFSGNLKKGSHSFIFDGTNFSSGLYFYRLISGEHVFCRKMMLVK